MNKNILFTSFVVIISIFASLALLILTPYGLAMSPDSVAYMKGARGIYNGEGLSLLQLLWPPLYPYAIALFGVFTNGDLYLSARLYNSVIYGINIYLTYLIINRSHINKFISLIISIFIYTNSALVQIHFYAWSEAGFILLLLINLLVLQNIIKNKSYSINTINIVLLSITTAASILMRHAGLSFLLANVLILLFISNNSLIKRIKITSSHLIITLLILVPWFIYYFTSEKQPRAFAFHPPNLNKIYIGLESIGDWYYSLSNLMIIKIIIGIVVCLLSIYPIFKYLYNKNSKYDYYQLCLSIYFITYIIFIIFALTIVDNAAPLDSRILSILFILFTIGISIYLFENKIKFITSVVILLLLFISADSAPKLHSWLLLNYYQGFELSSIHYKKNLQVLEYIKKCDVNSIVRSDTPWNFDLLFSKKVDLLPLQSDMFSGIINTDYSKRMNKLSSYVDLIIITDLKSHYIHEIDQLQKYTRIYENNDAIVWVNTNNQVCKTN